MVNALKNDTLQLCVTNKFLMDVVQQLYPHITVTVSQFSNFNTLHAVSIIESSDNKEVLKLITLVKQVFAKAICVVPRDFDIPESDNHNIHFLIKPFKIESLQNIMASFFKKEPLTLGGFLIDDQSKSILVFGDDKVGIKIRLTNKEFDIISFMAESSEPVLRKDILQKVFGYNELSNTNTVEVHLHRLKQKLSKHIDISKYIKE
ncbi:MAG: winged helix-turn-helix domain-containing protein [Rickettsiales bacterium]|nr:winged helix-turn-helix domain-containing protein [Rickettsiales bacterium]